MHAITEQQVAYFETFGFLLLRQAFDADEMAAFGARFDEMLTEDRGGIPFPGVRRQSLYRFAELDPLFTAMVADDRIFKTVEALLGKDFIWLCSEGNKYVGDTDWHPDGTRLDCRPMKVSLYLDPLTAQTGSLRVIPGSHRLPYHEALKPCAKFGLSDADIPCLPLETQPGDVVVFMENTFHAAFGGQPGRQQHAISFIENPRTPEQIAWTRAFYDRARYSFHPSESYINSDRPRIRRMVARLIELGFEALPY